MPSPSTPEPLPAPFPGESEKCTLHDGTWPLQQFIARMRSQPQRPAPVPIARSGFPQPDPVPRAAPRALRARPDSAALAAVELRRIAMPAPRTAEQVRPSAPAPRARPQPASVRPSAQTAKKRKRSAERRFVLNPEDADLKRQQVAPDNRQRVVRLRAKAEDLVRRNRLRDALKVMHQALACDRHDAHSLAYCGWLVLQDSPGSGEESLKLLDRAERADARCARVHYYRGMVLKALGQHGDAVMCFERALDLDPDDLQSAREVRLYAQRSGARACGDAEGLMGWLKKR
jgi:tetratricopeptide (TPR) repeat protein